MNNFTTSFSVDLVAFDALKTLVPELDFRDLANLALTGPFVYVLVEPRGGIAYYGKSDAATGNVGRRALSYPKWIADYQSNVAESGLLDPLYDPANGELELAWAAPIIRAAARFQLIVRVASVAHTGETGRTWEARLQALAGTLTTNESLIGGSGWEAKSGTLRNDGYAWVFERLEELRDNGDLECRRS